MYYCKRIVIFFSSFLPVFLASMEISVREKKGRERYEHMLASIGQVVKQIKQRCSNAEEVEKNSDKAIELVRYLDIYVPQICACGNECRMCNSYRDLVQWFYWYAGETARYKAWLILCLQKKDSS